MMLLKILFPAFFLLFSSPLLGQDVQNRLHAPPLSVHLDSAQIDSLFFLVSELQDSVELSIALLTADSTTFLGLRKVRGEVKIVENRFSVFEIGSITKVFTGALLSKAVQENRLSLDQKAEDLLSVDFKDHPPISLKHLATHTSGLPRMPDNMGFSIMGGNPFAAYTKELLFAYLKERLKLSSEPGQTYAYSNLGMGLLGFILAEQRGISFEELLYKDILKPLEMTYTGINMSPLMDSLLVPGRNAVGKRVKNWTFDCLAGAGAIRSNSVDLVCFLQQQFSDTTFYFQAQQEHFSVSEHLGIGLAWHILKKEDLPILLHDGGTAGYSSCMALSRKKKIGVVVLSNSSAYFVNAQNVSRACLDLFGWLNQKS
jgi:CubicO group peptidase (beta-lactamase class C family)